MKVNPHIFRGYDIRGLVDTDLTSEIALNIGKAHGTFLVRQGHTKAIVGRDCRATGQDYSEKVCQGMASTGLDVIDIGMQLVGTFYWAQHHLQVPGGAYVSASHNPPQFNGFKLANGYSETLVSDSIQQIRQLVESEDYEVRPAGTITQQDVFPAYSEQLLKRLTVKKKLRIVVDPGNSTAGEMAPELLRRAGCDVVEYNTTIDPSFPLGVADPTKTKVMERLRKEVIDEKADLGFTYDADGDRIGIVDENGRFIWNDVLVALFASDVLRQHPGETIMYNLLCSKVVAETILSNHGKPFMWRTGHSFLKKKNQEVKAAFIGELSGHFFFSKDFYNHDDGLYSTLRLLRYLSETNQTMSQAVDSLPKYISSPQICVGCDDDKKVALMDKIAPVLRKDFPEAEVIDDERAGDGLRLELSEGMFVVRYSQNGPYVTVKFESKTTEGYETLRKYILELLRSYQEVDWRSDINVNIEALEK